MYSSYLNPTDYKACGTTNVVAAIIKSLSRQQTEDVAEYGTGGTRLTMMIKKVKASHTRYRALGPELYPVYRQVTESHPPDCRLPLLFARSAVTVPAALWPVPSYTAW